LRQISEKFTRKELIDPQLDKAGWVLGDHSKGKIEISPVPLVSGVDGYAT
jgi:type I site-specific restriction endonuclease